MPMKSFSDAKRRLDDMIAAVSPDVPGGSVKTFERQYGDRYLMITIAEGVNDTIFTYGIRDMDRIDVIKLIQTWDEPSRAVVIPSNH